MNIDCTLVDIDVAPPHRIEQLGGSFVETHQIGDFTWNTFADPEGNVFDVAGE